MRILILLIYLSFFLTPLTVGAEESDSANTCFSFSAKALKYEDSNRGQVVFHIVKDHYTPTVTDLACIVGIEFLKTVGDVPDKAVVGVVTSDYTVLYAIQWSLKENYFLIIESLFPQTDLPNEETEWIGTFTKYPKPLSRLKEIISRTSLPLPTTMSPTDRAKFSVNRVRLTVPLLKKLINQGEKSGS